MLKFRTLVNGLNGLVLAAVLATPSVALAAAKDKSATSLRKEAMQTDYAETNFKKAEQKLKKAIKQCGKSACSSQVVGELHRDLATVYIAGLKQGAKGKSELKLALQANPDLELDDDFATPEVRKVFTDLGGHGPKPEPEEATEKSKDKDEDCESGSDGCKDDVVELKEDEPAPGLGAKNWLNLQFGQDFLIYSAQEQVCPSVAPPSAGTENYSCFQGGAPFAGNIAPGPGNQISGGLGRATSRILIGFDRLVSANVSLGLRLGYAFGGRPASADKFFPFHAELRASYWFGAAPFESSGVRPFVTLSGGLAEVDGRVPVEYYDPNGEKGEIIAYRKTGKGFAGLGFGVMVPFAGHNGIVLELRGRQMFGAPGTVFDAAIGYARGF